jgi:hypothetical protein
MGDKIREEFIDLNLFKNKSENQTLAQIIESKDK